jgi:type I restriction-modification system DNA methylase subunit
MEAISPWADDPETLELVSNGFGLLVSHYWLAGSFSDLLAPTLEHFLAEYTPKKRDDTAYFSTPWEVSRSIARMTVAGFSDEEIRRLKTTGAEPLKVQDPAIGTGMLLLALRGEIASRWGRKALRRLRCYGQDIDESCVLASKIQLRMSDDNWMTNFMLASHSDIAKDLEGAA